MDIVAHGLWAGAGIGLAGGWSCASQQGRPPISGLVALATIVMAMLPDLPQLVPITVWALFEPQGLLLLRNYSTALPGFEPALPPMVALLSHHLHCVMHSAVIAGAVTLITRPLWRIVGIPLLGWWSHIVIDVFTHSQNFYPSPVLYPFTQRGFDGLAWNTPWFLVANYVVLGLVYGWLLYDRLRRHPSSGPVQ